MKKIAIILALFALSLGAFSCGGGGAGSSNTPPGENPGIPSVVQLSPSHYIAQTNANITLHAKVLDGNGAPLKGVTVTFTNLSEPFGTLKPLAATTAVTNDLGIASMNLSSTTPGFATILAQVNTAVGIVRDRKSVFFSSLDVLAVSMGLDVDSVPGNGIYNETNDFILFQDPPILPQPDDTFEVLATVRNAGGVPVAGESVSWSSSHSEAGFVRTEGTTNLNGQAKAVIQVTPASIRNTETHLNVMASAGNGAANMVTLFLRPVIVSSVTVSADPTVVEPGGESDITAVVMLNTGARAPDGTTVSFTTTCGTVTPFSQTSGGLATATFKGPSTVPAGDICTVTATVQGVSGSVDITIRVKLAIAPPSATVVCLPSPPAASCGSAGYSIIGGVAPFTINVSHPSLVTVSPASPTSSRSITVTDSTDALPTADTTVTITVVDALGATATASFAIDVP